MLAIVSKLLKGTGVDEVTHPGLVGLLELAARGSGIPSGSAEDTPALRKRLLRDWYRVCDAFRACVSVNVSDAELLQHIPSGFGLKHDGRAWICAGPDPLLYRLNVAGALRFVAASKYSGSPPRYFLSPVHDGGEVVGWCALASVGTRIRFLGFDHEKSVASKLLPK